MTEFELVQLYVELGAQISSVFQMWLVVSLIYMFVSYYAVADMTKTVVGILVSLYSAFTLYVVFLLSRQAGLQVDCLHDLHQLAESELLESAAALSIVARDSFFGGIPLIIAFIAIFVAALVYLPYNYVNAGFDDA